MAPDNWSRVIHVSGGPEIKAWFEKYLHPQHAIEHPLQMGCMQTLHWRFPLKKHQKCFVDEETSLDFLLSWGEYMMTTSSFLGEPAGYGLSHDITSSTQSVTATNTFYASTNNHAVNIQESAKSPPTHTHTHTHWSPAHSLWVQGTENNDGILCWSCFMKYSSDASSIRGLNAKIQTGEGWRDEQRWREIRRAGTMRTLEAGKKA